MRSATTSSDKKGVAMMRHCRSFFIVLAGGAVLAGAMPKGMAGVAGETVVVTVGQESGDVRGTGSPAIQKALDLALEKAPKGGGQVIVKAGTYTIYGSLYIRGPVTLKGEGAKTILKKAPQYITALAKPLAADAVELEVKDIGPIKPGWGFSLNPAESAWATSIRYAVEVNGNRIKMDRPRNRELKFPQGPLPAGAKVQTSYPLIQILGVEGAVVEDLVLDGNLAENKDMQVESSRNGCIYMCAAAPGQEGGPGKHVVRRCVLRDFAGDGISWQGSADVTVEDVECTGMKDDGLHPGTNAVRPIVRNCRSHHNGGSGIYVCWDVKNGRFEQNVLEDNGAAGISTGHGDSDCLFAGNQVRRNRGPGVLLRGPMFPPDRCTFEKNVVEDNAGPGFYISAGIAGTVLTENVIRDTRKEEAQRTQKVALFSFSPVAMKDNKVEGQVRVPPSKDGSAAVSGVRLSAKYVLCPGVSGTSGLCGAGRPGSRPSPASRLT